MRVFDHKNMYLTMKLEPVLTTKIVDNLVRFWNAILPRTGTRTLNVQEIHVPGVLRGLLVCVSLGTRLGVCTL